MYNKTVWMKRYIADGGNGVEHGLPKAIIQIKKLYDINILKLPGADDGVSTALLEKLIGIEPMLSEYIYVFDAPSDDISAMRKMADAADVIVV